MRCSIPHWFLLGLLSGCLPAVNSLAQTVEVRVASSVDDAEESIDGDVSVTSSDLEMTQDRGGAQWVGMRFRGVDVPPGSTVVNAYVQFQADESTRVATTLTVRAEAVGDAASFASDPGNISSRSVTDAGVSWSPPRWFKGDATLAQRTPDLSSVIQ